MDQAKVGDKVVCSCKGGPHTIVQGAKFNTLDGVPVARVGDKSSCGATITSGLSWFMVEGSPAAIDGSTTSCGGKVIASCSSHTGSPSSYTADLISASTSILKKYNEKIKLVDPRGIPFAYQKYIIIRSNGNQEHGKTDQNGVTHLVKDHDSPEKIKILLVIKE